MTEPKPIHAKRSFLEPLHIPKTATNKVAATADGSGATTATTTKAPPSSSVEWLQLASQLLIAGGNNGETEDRALLMCEEAAGMLLEDDSKARAMRQREHRMTAAEAETAVYSPQEAGGAEDDDAALLAHGAHGAMEDEAAAQAPSTERLQAAYLLTAAALAAVEAHRLPAAESAIRLARAAVEAHRCPMTACTLADACVHWGTVTRDLERRSAAFQTALSVIATTCRDVLDADAMTAETAGYVVRMAWMLVSIGAASQAREPLTAVLEAQPQNYMALLLLTLLHTADGDLESADAAVMHLIAAYPQDVVGVVVHAALQQCSSAGETSGAEAQRSEGGGSVSVRAAATAAEEAAEELAVAMARITKLADEAVAAEVQGVKKKSLKALCTHCAPDESVEGGPTHSYGELRRRVVGHWALLGHVATRLGCTTMAEVATAAGTAAVSRSRLLYHRSFADLQCSQARLSLIRLKEEIFGHHSSGHDGPASRALVRDMNLLGQWGVESITAESTPLLGLPLTAAVSDGLSASSLSASPAPAASSVGGLHRNNLVSSKLFDAVASTLMAAVEAFPNHAEAHTLLGVTRLLEAAQVDLPSDTRHNRLQEASRHFLNAMRADGTYADAYTGAGVVAEAQGALTESFDYYASAAEASVQAPLIPWRYFWYLYE